MLISQSLGAAYGGRAIAENPGTFDAWFVDGGDADLVETAIKYTPIAPLVPIVKHFMDRHRRRARRDGSAAARRPGTPPRR